MKKLGPYDLEGTLGRGGMGTVFRGRHKETGEVHAVKVLAPIYSLDDHFRGRFESEINALLQLDHPNIVKLVSYGQEDGNLYFSMELVEGNSLFQLQRKGHLFNWREVLSIAKDVCQGLRHAHDRGIIHRDLKPGNLLITKFKSVKITDFGIAKSYGTSQNTGDNILGTMDFMSPEQAKGEPVTFRSDLYSLGAVMYTLLSGRSPFSANSIEESLRNLTRVPAPRIGSKVPDIPPEIDDLIARLMEKKPKNRVATAMALHHQLADIETALKSYSEARTAELKNPKTSISNDEDEDSATVMVNTDHEKMPTVDRPDDDSTKNRVKEPELERSNSFQEGKTVIDDQSQAESSPKTHSANRPDFHNRVNREQRGAVEAEEDPIEAQYGKGILPTLLLLLAVVLVATFLALSSYKLPSAEDLYTQIQSQPPSKVIKECERYLDSYPDADEERTQTVKRIYEFGKATKYYSQLSNRLKAKSALLGENRLTEIERQFMEIADLAKTDFEEGNIRMDAFVTIHDPDADLSPRDRECAEAAKSFLLKIRGDARRQAKTTLESISRALARAAKQKPVEAMRTYRSIIKLYGSMNKSTNPEVLQMVAQAQQMLSRLESEAADTSVGG